MRNLRFAAVPILWVWAAMFLENPVVSQTASSSLRGTVTDPSGAVVGGAQAVLSNPSTGYSRSVATNSQGVYEFVEVPPATYELSVTATGFASFKQANLVLAVATPATLNVSLQLAGAAETVSVNTEAPLINTVDASVGHAFNTLQIENLPFEGRDPTAILSLQAGVVYTGSNAAQNTSFDSRSGAVAGARSDQANITIDGFDNNNPLQGLPFQGSLRSTLDSLQEFRVITTAGGAADSGYSSGAQVTLVTKSGTNQFHGSLYEYNRPTNTVANDYFNKLAEENSGLPNVPGRVLRNTFGGSVGGPILKNKLFFFYTYEAQRLRESTQVTRLVPSQNMRNGILTYPCAGAACPASGTFTLTPADLAKMDPNCSTPSPGFPQGTCPLGPGANPAVEAVLNKYPLPNALNAGDGFNIVGYTFSAPAPTNLNTHIARLDYTINANNQIFVRGNLQQDSSSSPPQFPGYSPNTVARTTPKALAVGYTSLLRPNLTNSFRFGYLRQVLASQGLQTQPYVSWDKMSSLYGETPTTIQKDPVPNFVDDLTWTKGSHTLQFGTNIRIPSSYSFSTARSFSGAITNPNGLFLSAIANTGGSLDPGAFGYPSVASSYSSNYDFAAITLAGLISGTTATYNLNKQGDQLGLLPQGSAVTRNFRAVEAEWYAQDAWRVTPSLTVTFGARYSLLQPPYETNGNQVAPMASLNQFFLQREAAMNQGLTYSTPIGFGFSGQANGKAPLWGWDYGNIAPRVAFAWSPSFSDGILGHLIGKGKTSIRGGFGIYYDHFGQGVVDTFNNQGEFGLSSSTTSPPLGVITVDQAARFSGINVIPTQAAGGCSSPPCSVFAAPPPGGLPYYPPSSLSSGGFAITWGLDDRLKTPYADVVSVSIQRELPKNLVFEASYIGRFGHRLLQEEDLAMPLDIKDPKSGMDYFAAATALDVARKNHVPIQSIAPIAFWEDMFPTAAGPASSQLYGAGFGACAPHGGTPISGSSHVTATQAMYNAWSCNPLYSDTFGLFNADVPVYGTAAGGCFPACATINGKQTNGFAFFLPQFASLYAWRSIGSSNYNGLQLSLRGRMKSLVFDVNYTFSKSLDYGSNAEYINEFQGAGFADQVVNAWKPRQNYGPSNFDLRHQVNANWVLDVPWGAGRHWGSQSKGVLNAVLGGWQVTGLFRLTSGFPFTVLPGALWATNWQLTQPAVLVGPAPKTGSYSVNGFPNVFQNGSAAASDFQPPFPGESGTRNALRGPGLFDIDAGLLKTWSLSESTRLIFGWQVYNVTNTPTFDVGTMSTQNGLCYCTNNTLTSAANFGNLTSTLTKPRVMEFSLRLSF